MNLSENIARNLSNEIYAFIDLYLGGLPLLPLILLKFDRNRARI